MFKEQENIDFNKTVRAIYSILNTANNKQYVGSSRNLKSRLSSHFNLLKTQKHPNQMLQADFNEFGADKFSVSVLCTLEKGESISDKEHQFTVSINPAYNAGRKLPRSKSVDRLIKPITITVIEEGEEVECAIITIKQGAQESLLSVGNIEYYIKQLLKTGERRIDTIYPFPHDGEGSGPKFIICNDKWYNFIEEMEIKDKN